MATWGNRADYNNYVQAFGVGKPRMVSEFPKRKNWRREVLQALPENISDGEKMRVVELIRAMTDCMVARKEDHYDNSLPWLENAEQTRIPFHAILARDNPRNHPDVMLANSLDTDGRWNIERSKVVKRQAVYMSNAISNMLSNCQMATFIDPHFGPENQRYCRPFKAFLHAITKNRGGPALNHIEIMASSKADFTFFKENCETRLSPLIPAGFIVRFTRLKKKIDGEALHNRYILTDLGGVTFQHGLDEGKKGETDDVTLMDRSQYIKRKEQYCGKNPAFDTDGETFEVAGCASR